MFPISKKSVLIAGTILLCSIDAKPRPAAPIAVPLTFEPNDGQTDKRVKFLAHGQKSTLWLTEQGAVLAVDKSVFRIRFQGGARAPKMEAEDPRGGVSNYLTGSDPSKWHVHVKHFGKVRYREVYPGIDVVFYGNPQKIEYDFVVAPGADPARIRVTFDGIDGLRVDSSGDLVLQTRQGEIRNRKPAIYQQDRPVEGHYVLRGKRSAGFAVENYDKAQPLVIDPVLTYATLLGGTGGDQVQGLGIDAQGMIYVGGETTSTNFPLKNPLFPTGADQSVFEEPSPSAWLAKINPSASGGNSLVYSTYIGGTYPQEIQSLAADAAGNVVVTGFTDSTPDDGFPLKNAFQSVFSDSVDCAVGNGPPNGHCFVSFVMKIAPAGDSVVYCSYLGGSNYNLGHGITLDSAGNAYVVGATTSSDFPVKGGSVPPYQTNLRQTQNGFLSIVGPQGALIYSTYFGGGTDCTLNSVAVDAAGLIYVAGTTSYTGLPTTPGAFQRQGLGNVNTFVVIFNLSPNANNEIQYCTYLGGPPNGNGGAYAITNSLAVDRAGNIYIGGSTDSLMFPTTPNAPFPTTTGSSLFSAYQGAFVTELNPSAQGNAQLVYSTYFGDGGTTSASGIAVDSSGRITIAGTTNSFLLTTTPDAFQCCYDGELQSSGLANLGFVARFDPSVSGANSLVYASYLGGIVNTILNDLAQDSAGKALVVGGWTQSIAPVTSSAYQQSYNGQGTDPELEDLGDAYLARFDMGTPAPQITGVYNAGGLSHLNAALSPGLIFQIRGSLLGPGTPSYTELDSNGLVTGTNAGVQVMVNGIPAPLIYVSTAAINAIAPYELTSQIGQPVRVQVIYNGVASNLFPVQVNATAPGILNYDDGGGQAVIGNQDYSANSASNPAAIGSVITIYATGEGQTTPPGVDGLPANNFNNLPHPTAPVTVTIGGLPANVKYSGGAPTAVAGLFQVNVTVPTGVIPGPSVPILLTVGGVASQTTVTMAVKAQ